MATKLYYRQGISNTYSVVGPLDTGAGTSAWKVISGANVSAWPSDALLTTAGPTGLNRVSTATVAGPTSGIEINNSTLTLPYQAISPPLDADITISGTMTFNLWGLESSMSANAAINCMVERMDASGNIVSTVIKTANTTELGTSYSANNFTATPTSTNFNKGDRIRVRLFIDDAGTMGSGFTASVSTDGATGAQGDTWIEFNENLTFQTTTPAGTTLYFTNTASTVATAANDLEIWTTAGSSTQTAVTNTVAGPTGNIQITGTAGGTVIDWWTKPLAAVTLSGPVAVTLATQESNTLTFGAMGVEIARVDNDGTSPLVWGKNMAPVVGTSVADTVFWVSGDDLAISDGQRLRIRVFIDDNLRSGALVTGRTITFSYNGTAGGSADSSIIFTDTLNLAPTQTFGQTQARIKQTYTDKTGQAQATLKATMRAWAQANAVVTRNGDTKVIDSFTRSVTDGLGTANTGGAWTYISGVAANADVNGSAATFQMDTATRYVSNLKDVLISPANEGVSIRFRMQFSILPTADQNLISIAGLLGSTETDANTQGLHVVVSYKQSTDRLAILVENGTTGLDLSGSSGAYFQTPDINTNYWVEVLVSPTSGSTQRVRARMYQDGAIPSDPVTTTTALGAPLPGHAGLVVFTKASSPPVVTLDDLEIQRAGWTVSGQAMARIQGRVYGLSNALINGTATQVIDTFTRSVTDGLGTADTGGSYTLIQGTAADADVNGTEATFQKSSSLYITNLNNVLIGPGISTNFRFKVSIAPDANNSLFQVDTHLGSRTTISGIFTTTIDYTVGSNTLTPNVLFGGTSAGGTARSFVADTWYIYESYFTGSSDGTVRLKWRLYQEGTTPPASNTTFTNSNPISVFIPGHVGITILSKSSGNLPLISIDDINIKNHSGWTESGQAQATISAVASNRGYAQAQADVKQTYTDKTGQSQADIKATRFILGQAQACIRGNAFAQTQADIKAIGFGLGQANADIKNTATNYTTPYGQSQADIKATSRGLGQTQADIKQTYFALGQAQADIKAIGNGFGQAQADIKATNFGLGQANADIKQTYTDKSGQAQANIKATNNGFGQSQADIKQTYTDKSGQAQAKIDAAAAITISACAQAQADIKQTYTDKSGQTQADIKAISFGLAQTQADIKATSNGLGQAQTDIKQTYFGLAQAQADIKAIGYGSGQAQADIKNTYFGLAQSQADIKNTYYGLGQAQATIRGNAFAQAQADIKNTYFGLGQSQADIKAVGRGFAQTQADIKATSFGLAQAQADIKAIGYGLGQSQADIKNTYYGLGQAQADIKATNSAFGQAQADIKAVGNGSGQSQADIKNAYFGLAQAQADIKNIYFGLGQAQADIKAVGNGSGQSQADIKNTYFGLGQAQAQIKNTYFGLGQAQAEIKNTYFSLGQCQAFLYISQVAHPDADISVTGWVRTVI